MKKTFYVLKLSALLFLLSACVGGGGGGGGSEPYANISGTLSESAGSASVFGTPLFEKPLGTQNVGRLAVGDCSVKAYDIDSNALITTTSTDSLGKYSLSGSGIEAGKTYKIIADCGSNSLSVIAAAENSDPTQINDEDRVKTNPRSTIISAYIFKAIKTAITEATSGLGNTEKDAVKVAILSALDSIVQTITEVIQEAIESGSMAEPNLGSAKTVADGLKNANDATEVDSSLGNAGVNPPKSVDQAVDGAQRSSLLKSACDSSLTGASLQKCQQAIARFIYNTLGFSILIRRDGGGMFGNSGCAASTTTNVTGKNLEALFPNGEFLDPNTIDSNLDSGDHCMIRSKLGRLDRNRGYQDGGGEDHGPTFTETGDLDGGNANDDVGVLTALATALYNKNSYNLKSLDQFVFGYRNGAGMNMRMLKQERRWTEISSGNFQMKNILSAWSGSAWTELNVSTACNSSPCRTARDLVESFNFSSMDWSSRTANTSLADSLSAQDHVALNVFYHQYGGAVPSQRELDREVNQGRVHRDYNVSGSKEFQVLTDKPQRHSNDGTNPCFDGDPATPCIGKDGNAISARRFSMSLASNPGADGFRPITQLTASATGEIVLRPMYGPLGFSGVFGLINYNTGRIVRDELTRERAIKIVFNSSECNTNGLPSSGCATSDVFNVSVDWKSCNHQVGDPCPSYTASGSKITTTASDFSLRKDYLSEWRQLGGSNNPHYGLLARGTWESKTLIDVSVTVDGSGADAIAPGNDDGDIDDTNEYGIAIHWNCTSTACNPGGFVLVTNQGVPLHDAQCTTCSTASQTNWNGTIHTASIYNASDIENLVVVTANSRTVAQLSLNYQVHSGPIRNRHFACEGEPYFVDGNGNGKLDCTRNAQGFSIATEGDISFSYMEEYLRAKEENRVPSSSALIPRKNAFVFKDPVGTKKLLSNAFNGWFDGNHSIDQNTSFDAIQTFALIFLFFEADGEKHIKELCNGGAIGGGTSSCSGAFVPVGPFDRQNGFKSMNGVIGKAMDEFKTN